MASSKLAIASLLIVASLLLLQVAAADVQDSQAKGDVAEKTLLKKMDCGGACSARCRLSSRPRLCQRACGTCCARCDCVPPGTSGNLDACPCYASLTTHRNKRKCP
ncbi:gibberellin-regulated protein 1-like isoform X1 [Eucalyptus grandis]|uniref:gibberellin-regulated protein 1-like isoform X1 n=1 Tax=Eucalyptus grandis TaxID=71139 RepID=UPI00192EE6E6|nr:gibberellin-regulated protein 1-like isoform X1 [Eucalyptus grandis]